MYMKTTLYKESLNNNKFFDVTWLGIENRKAINEKLLVYAWTVREIRLQHFLWRTQSSEPMCI